jgi:hypothetical protein
VAEKLGAPDDPLDIYLEEASWFRPIACGDVFRDVAIPGAKEEDAGYGLMMVIAHPSAMRRGPDLEPKARAASVVPVEGLSRTKWTKGHAGIYPLPRLSEVALGNGFDVEDHEWGWGALLDLAAPIESKGLNVRERLACLSPTGISLLLQKVVYSDTRYAVKQVHIERAFAPKLEEIEMLQTWNEELVRPRVDEGVDLREALQDGAREFDKVMNETNEERTTSIRALLEGGRHSGRAQVLLTAEIRSRRIAEDESSA